MERELVSESLEDTLALGARIGAAVVAGDFIALEGPLGAGKSRLAEGIARGLGIPADERIPSPTFTIVNEHAARLLLVHADFYRLGSPEELDEIGWRDYEARECVFVVEWLSRIGERAPDDRLTVELAPRGGDTRAIRLSSSGPASERLFLALAARSD
ncbi:MAG: tRNA (adenosine(37)-N6)-threonylcarbamoyltransferase complex ATPase subunit type 1 TsaE [Polyangia bacterium]